MKHNTPFRIIILTSFLSFCLSGIGSKAMEDVTKDQTGKSSKEKRYFHREPDPVSLNNATIDLEKEGEEQIYVLGRPKKELKKEQKKLRDSTARKSEKDKNVDQVREENVDVSQVPLSPRLLVRSSSRIIKSGLRSFKKKSSSKKLPTDLVVSDKIQEQDETTLETVTFSPETQIIPDNSSDRPKKIVRQRSWGRNPTIDSSKTLPLSPRESNALLPDPVIQIKVTEEDQQVSRSQKRLSQKRPSQNPLQRGLSSTKLPVLNFEGQHQDLSPRNPMISPRNLLKTSPRNLLKTSPRNLLKTSPRSLLKISPRGQGILKKPVSQRYSRLNPSDGMGRGNALEDTSEDPSEEFSEKSSEEFSEESNENDENISFSSDEQDQEQKQSLVAIKYNENMGNAQFVEAMDNRLLGRSPRVIVGLGVLGSVMFGAFTPTAMTGVNVNVTGYYFDIPPGKWLSTTLVATFMTTFTLALLQEGYEWGQTIGWPVWHAMKACYSGTKEDDVVLSAPLSDNVEYRWKIGYKNSPLDYVTNAFAFIAALPDGVLPAALLSLVWAKDYSNLVIPFGCCVLVRYGGQAYNANTKIVRYLLNNYINQEPEGEFISTVDDPEIDALKDDFYEHNLDSEQAKKNKISYTRGHSTVFK